MALDAPSLVCDFPWQVLFTTKSGSLLELLTYLSSLPTIGRAVPDVTPGFGAIFSTRNAQLQDVFMFVRKAG